MTGQRAKCTGACAYRRFLIRVARRNELDRKIFGTGDVENLACDFERVSLNARHRLRQKPARAGLPAATTCVSREEGGDRNAAPSPIIVVPVGAATRTRGAVAERRRRLMFSGIVRRNAATVWYQPAG